MSQAFITPGAGAPTVSGTQDGPRPPMRFFETRDIAIALARNTNWRVFPCCMPKKLPAIGKAKGGAGFHDASADPDIIAKLWRRGAGDLIGVATGAMSGIDVLDIDVKHPTAIAWWAAASKRISPTRIYRTNGGGHHVYFQHAEGVKNNQNKMAYGVDTRGDGGYAIFWYANGCECLDHSPIAPWPAWLLECVLWEKPKEQVSPPPPLPPRRGHSGRRPYARGQSYTQASADHAITAIIRKVSSAAQGERNCLLFWGAHRLREREQQGQISRAEASGLLIGAALAAGLDSDEATRTVESAWRAA